MVVFLPRLTKCCFCIPLRTGALIVGYFSLLLSLAIISVMSVSLYRVVKYVGDHKNNPTPGFTAEEMQTTAVGLYVSHAYFIIVFLYCCVISLMLIVGLHRNNLRLVRYYVTTAIVSLVMVLALVVLTFVYFGLIATLPLLKWSLILYYFVIVVHSAYLEMEDREKPVELHDMSRPPGPTEQPLIYG
ncbi:uncharacterized protein LOC113239695 [Hyposmocoma kahamanoa]|uniref:uncharacterized protein LOC113239695 n=1 Tax=Hyposmocoma kahamanoa TaxID=1477025 RepID=UPI000E6D6F2C|nr:uncharacterized protein LOC113239695 [Hyposmocoma kahamanoa]